MGSPPNCRPECTINPDCPSNRACMNEKCSDPCPGSCGFGAICNVIHHTPACSCPEDFTGDPFNSCQPLPPERKIFLSQFREYILFYLFSYLNLPGNWINFFELIRQIIAMILQRWRMFHQIFAIPHLVARTQSAIMVSALAFPNIMETHTNSVALNVF